jgi:hypothetical protein
MARLLLILFSLVMFSTLGGCYAADPYPTYPVYTDSYAVYETERYDWEPRRSYKRERFWDRDDRDDHDGPHGFRDGVRSREGRRGFHR